MKRNEVKKRKTEKKVSTDKEIVKDRPAPHEDVYKDTEKQDRKVKILG